MRNKNISRALALVLTLTLALSGTASALTVEDARDILRETYIDPIPEEILNLPTIEEITAALGDPYTYYMTPEQYAAFQNDLNDTEVVGIGVMVELQSTGLLVTRVAIGSPAEGAGLQAGDRIVAAQGVTIEEAGTPNALSVLIPGEEGTDVTVTYERDGKSIDITMQRAPVVFPMVEGKLTDGHVGFLTYSSFGEDAGTEFRELIEEYDAKADRWVVDLRGNPGGLASAVIESAAYSIGNSTVAHIADREGATGGWRLSPFPIEIDPLLTEPMIVLTDGSSASASELYAAAMRDYGTALLIGERTFGKGIGQEILEQEDGSALRVTSFRYFAPQYVTPDKTGVLPNLVVEAGMADRVAALLSGKSTDKPSAEVLTITLVGWDWYVHKSAVSRDEDAFAALLSALPGDAPIALNGKATNMSVVAKTWGVDYDQRGFNDVASSPYREQLEHMAVLGLLEGDGKGGFDPQGQITRAQLCSLLTNAMGYWNWVNERELPFADVAEDDWFYVPVKIMYELGLVSGVDGTTFAPNAPVTHQELLTILGRMGNAADLTIRERLETPEEAVLRAPDVTKFAPWAQSAAAVAKQLEYTCKPLGEIDPTAPATREEAAATLYNMMRYMQVITLTEDYVPQVTEEAA